MEKRVGAAGLVLAAILAASSGARAEEYIFVTALSTNPFFRDTNAGTIAAAKEMGVTWSMVGPADLDIPGEASALEQAIAKRPAGIFIISFDEALAPIIDKGIEAGIPIVTIDSDAPSSKRLAYLGTNNYEMGRAGGKVLADALGGKGEVAISTILAMNNLSDRMKGYLDVFKNYPDIKVVATVEDKGDVATGAAAMAAVLQGHPNLAGIAALDSASAGAARAVVEAGKQGQVKIVTADRGEDVLDLIKDGTIYATIAQKSALMGYYAVKMLYDYNHHPIPVSLDNKAAGITAIPSNVDTGVVVIKHDNVQYFYHKN